MRCSKRRWAWPPTAWEQRFSKRVLTALLMAPDYIRALKDVGAHLVVRFKSYRLVKVHLGSGQTLEVVVPYFVTAPQEVGAVLGVKGAISA